MLHQMQNKRGYSSQNNEKGGTVMTGIEIFGQVVAAVIYSIPVFLFSVTLIGEVIQCIKRLIKRRNDNG